MMVTNKTDDPAAGSGDQELIPIQAIFESSPMKKPKLMPMLISKSFRLVDIRRESSLAYAMFGHLTTVVTFRPFIRPLPIRRLLLDRVLKIFTVES